VERDCREWQTNVSAAPSIDMNTGYNNSMQIANDFWIAQQRMMLVGDDGAIRFTRTGRAKYAPLLAGMVLRLTTWKTVEGFVEAHESSQPPRARSHTRELEKVMNDPATTEVEREVIRRALAADYTE